MIDPFPHLQAQTDQQVKDTQAQAILSASLPPADCPNDGLTFFKSGYAWNRHTPGDPMPCEPKTLVFLLFRCMESSNEGEADEVDWGKFPHCDHVEIIGWRYATPPQEKAAVTLSPRQIKQLSEALDLLDQECCAASNTVGLEPSAFKKWMEEASSVQVLNNIIRNATHIIVETDITKHP